MVQKQNFNICNYIFIPLVLGQSFDQLQGFQNSYLDLEEFKLLIVAHPASFKSTVERYEISENLCVAILPLPEKVETVPILEFVEHFVNGNYSKIPQYVLWNISQIGSFKNRSKGEIFDEHYWFYLYAGFPKVFKERLESYLGIELPNNAELISKPNDTNFSNCDELLEKLIEHEC